MVEVTLTRHLCELFPGLDGPKLEMEASTVADVLAELEKAAPGIGFYICDERGRLRQHVNVFIGEERVADRERLRDRLEPGSRVFIMQALSGG